MAELSLICLTLYAVTSLVVGTRLIARSWRSRGLPEFLIGCTYAVASGSGYPLSVVAPYLSGRVATLAAMIVAQVLIVLGCSAFAFFNAKVFRPSASWSVPVAALGSLVFAGSGIGVIAAFISAPEGALAAESARSATAVFLFALVACQAWTALEGLRHYRMMKRRLALGLADAVVTNRFLLWGISGAISVTWNGVVISALLAGANVSASPVPVLAVSLGGLASAVCLVLTFMPPVWYLRWLERERERSALATV